MNATDLLGILNSDRSESEKLKAIIDFSGTPIKDKKQYEYFAANLSSLLPSLWEKVKNNGKNSNSMKCLKLLHEKVFTTAENLHTTGFLCPFFKAFETYFPEVESKLLKPESIGIKEKDLRRITYPQEYSYLLSKFDGRKEIPRVQEVVHTLA